MADLFLLFRFEKYHKFVHPRIFLFFLFNLKPGSDGSVLVKGLTGVSCQVRAGVTHVNL